MKRNVKILLLSLAIIALGAGYSLAAIWSSNDVCLLYGTQNQGIVYNPVTDSLEGVDRDMTILTFDHASAWKYGDNFFFFDITQPFDNGTAVYGEWHPRLSFGKMTGSDLSFAFVKDVLVATEINVSDGGGRVFLYGAGFDLDIPHFSFFSLNVYIRDDKSFAEETTYQISPAWNIPFNLGGARFEFGGFLDYSGSLGEEGAIGSRESQLITQPQLLLDIGNFSGKPRNVYAGIEFQYWKNKYGIKDIDEAYVQFMGKWVF